MYLIFAPGEDNRPCECEKLLVAQSGGKIDWTFLMGRRGCRCCQERDLESGQTHSEIVLEWRVALAVVVYCYAK